MKEILEIAKAIAREVHEGQKRPIGKADYITHPEAVAELVDTDEEKIVAWLHDVIEDSDLNYLDLMAKGIPNHLAYSVALLSRVKSQSYLEYLFWIKTNEIAIKVKIADLKHNLLDLKNGNMRDKYVLALDYLEKEVKKQGLKQPCS